MLQTFSGTTLQHFEDHLLSLQKIACPSNMNHSSQDSPQCTLTWRRLKAGASLQFAPAHILTHAHMEIWNPKSEIQNLYQVTSPHVCSPAQRSNSGIQSPESNKRSKICTSSYPHTCSPNQISGIQNPRSKIFISSHPHLPKDLEYKI